VTAHLFTAALCVLVPAVALAQQPQQPTVVTVGEGIVQAVPDRAWMTLTAESRAGNPREAQRRNADVMQPVLDKLRGAGVPAEAIRTVGYDLQQEWDFVDGRRVSRGYVARNSVEVRVDMIDRVGELLDIAVSSGATSVGGIRFDLKDRARLEQEALRLAVADARARAEALTTGAGRTLGPVLRIEEQAGVVRPPIPYMAVAREAAQSDAPPISAGQIEIRAQVTLTAVIQ
jgi:uncharacterized protein YggE